MSEERQKERQDPAERRGGSHTGASRPTILVVDDDAAVRQLLREVLHLHGYRVIDAAAVQEADQLLQRLGAETMALVITDVHLSDDPAGQEGYDFYQRWVAVRPTLHFLLISGDPGSRALPAVRSGAVRFLIKPFTINELLGVVRALVGL